MLKNNPGYFRALMLSVVGHGLAIGVACAVGLRRGDLRWTSVSAAGGNELCFTLVAIEETANQIVTEEKKSSVAACELAPEKPPEEDPVTFVGPILPEILSPISGESVPAQASDSLGNGSERTAREPAALDSAGPSENGDRPDAEFSPVVMPKTSSQWWDIAAMDIRPVYPIGSRLRGEEGVVGVEVEIGPAGHVRKASVCQSSGFPELDRAALEACRKAKCVMPADTAGSLRKAAITFRFKLIDDR